MGLYCEFDIINDYGFIESTDILEIRPDYSAGCEAFMNTFLEQARILVPVDTGYLRSTLAAGWADTWCYAETQCEYAQYPEYGTWCQTAQPYFEPAIQAALMAAIPLWKQAEEEAKNEEREELAALEDDEYQRVMEGAPKGPVNIPEAMALIMGAIILIALLVIAKEMLKDLFGPEGESELKKNLAIIMPEIYII